MSVSYLFVGGVGRSVKNGNSLAYIHAVAPQLCPASNTMRRTNSVNVIVEPLPIGLGLNNCIRVDPWSRLSIPEGRKLFLVGDLRLSHPINKQSVTIWVSVNLSSALSLRKNLVVLALYQYSRPSPLSEADNIANPRGGVA
ncbi:hypothetical protein J6590_017648 [Homalodisca vitripennis]|nr:hypothetical protein J6590_017648 [Homalodisca vitripennis]